MYTVFLISPKIEYLNAQQLLFEPFSDIIGNFGCVEPKLNLLSHFTTIYYLKHIKSSSPLDPLLVEIDKCTH